MFLGNPAARETYEAKLAARKGLATISRIDEDITDRCRFVFEKYFSDVAHVETVSMVTTKIQEH